MRISETFHIDRPPDVVFDYVSDPSKLGDWQTGNRSVEPLGAGPVGQGSRFRERTKPPGMREFEQITEFADFDRPGRLRVHVVDGPQPVDGTWTFAQDGAGTRVSFVAEGDLRGPMRLLEPLVKRAMARQFAGYHRNLRRNVEAAERA
jgi:carbon monoxide dehydrogenase subunit G